MIELKIDGHLIKSKDDLYEVIGQQLPLPDYFGNNLDALHDIITEKTEVPCVTVNHFKELRHNISGRYLLSFFSMITDCGGEVHILN